MSSNTKYTAAPQRDSIDEFQYSRAPPSYEPNAAADQAALLGGAARSSEDNVPDDFKVCGYYTIEEERRCADDGSLEGRSRRLLLISGWRLFERFILSCKLSRSEG